MESFDSLNATADDKKRSWENKVVPHTIQGGVVGSPKKLPENLIALTDADLKPNEVLGEVVGTKLF